MLIDKSAETQGTAYTISNLIGSTAVDGVGPAEVAADGAVERLELRAGSGNDTFDIPYFENSTTNLVISAGAGDDLLQIAPVRGDLYDLISPLAQFSFDGGSGHDTFTLDNSGSNDTWYYTRIGDLLNVARITPLFAMNISPANFEVMSVTAGSGNDVFVLEALAAGQSLAFNGGSGFDSFDIGEEDRNTQQVLGQVVFDGGGDGGNLSIDDSANTTGARLHVDQSGTLAAPPATRCSAPADRCSTATWRTIRAVLGCP